MLLGFWRLIIREFFLYVLKHKSDKLFCSIALVLFCSLIEHINDIFFNPDINHHLGHPPFIHD